MPGRRPKPTALKVVAGNPGKRALNREEPKPTAVVPDPPPWLDARALEEWRRMTPELEQLGLLTVVDRDALAAYCQALSRWEAAEKAIAAAGTLTYETALGAIMRRPEVTIARECMEQVRKFAAEFGLTPATRSRLHVQPPKQKDPREERAKRLLG